MEGNIITEARRESFPDMIVLEKRKEKAESKKINSIITKTTKKGESKIMKSNSIFSENSSNDDSIK